MSKKKRKAKIIEYPHSDTIRSVSSPILHLLPYGTVNGMARLLTCNREGDAKFQTLEIHGKIVGPIVHVLNEDEWEILECEIVIIPRRRIISGNTRMQGCTAQQIYLSDIFTEMENHYMIRDEDEKIEHEKRSA